MTALRRLCAFLYDNVGNLASPSSIAKAMTAGGQSISAPTVTRYLAALEAAFLVYPADRYGVRDNYPKTLLTLDDAREQSYNGIRRIYALDWLLGESEA